MSQKEKSLPSEKALLRDFLKRRGMKITSPREKILDVFLEEGRHVSPDELLEKIRRRHRGVGRATVYRTLKLLTEARLATSVEFGDGALRFENACRRSHHDHLVCLRCGTSIEFVDPRIERLQENVVRRHGFTPQRHRLEIFGLCKRCMKE